MLLEMIIASFCGSLSNVNVEACNKAWTAASIQAGYTQQVHLLEDGAMRLGNEEGAKILGQDTWAGTGFVLGLGWKIHKDHGLEYKISCKQYLPFDYIKPGVSGLGNPQSSSLSVSIGWSF